VPVRPTVKSAARRVQRDGLLSAVAYSVPLSIRQLTGQRLSRWLRPTLNELAQATSRGIHLNPQEMLQELLEVEVRVALLGEAARAVSEVRGRASGGHLAYPHDFQIGEMSRTFLYLLVQLLRPARVVETGIADGMSTAVLLRALGDIGSGSLTSIDVSEDVGSLLSSDERDHVDVRILRPGQHKRDLASVLQYPAPGLDLFIHDSDHSFAWASFEYRIAWSVLSSGGVLVSDDVDLSYAFLQFCMEGRLVPVLLFDGRKVIGAVRKTVLSDPEGNRLG